MEILDFIRGILGTVLARAPRTYTGDIVFRSVRSFFFFFFAANSPQMTTNYAALDSYRNRWFAAANEINKTRPRERGGGGGGGEGKRSQE